MPIKCLTNCQYRIKGRALALSIPSYALFLSKTYGNGTIKILENRYLKSYPNPKLLLFSLLFWFVCFFFM